MVLRRVGIWSAAKISGALYAGLGFLFGCIFALVSLFGAGLASMSQTQDAPPAWLGMLFGLGAIFLLPLFYGVMGLVTGALFAGLYNLFARLVGGLEIELE